MKIPDGSEIVVWFSCGAASAVAAKLTIMLYGQTCNVRVVNNPVLEEHEDNRRFLADVEKWLGVKIELAVNDKFPNASIVEVFDKVKYVSGVKGAPCTRELKKEARYQFELRNKIDFHVLGFTSEESKRYKRFALFERENTIPVLIDANISKADCFTVLSDAGISMPEIYSLGYPNANCIGCVKSTSPTYWNHVRLVHPEIFNARAEQSKRIGCKLVRYKGKRMFLNDLPTCAQGRPMKNMEIECGIFCIEKNKL